MPKKTKDSAIAITKMAVAKLRLNAKNLRTHSKKQIAQIADSIRTFGFVNPVLIGGSGDVIAGHGRLAAAESLGLQIVPVIVLDSLSAAKRRALAIADNKIASNAGWDFERLALEIPELAQCLPQEGIDLSILGFEPAELDQIASNFGSEADPSADDIEDVWNEGAPASQANDTWILGNHRISQGDARDQRQVARLMQKSRAAMAFLDPPYNVKIASVVGRGQTKHREFAMASGEMSPEAFRGFLTSSLTATASVSRKEAVHFVCIDWRHVADLVEVAEPVYAEFLNLVVWAKTNAGQGSFYRSQHELIGVFRVGDAPHLNNIELGKHGRSRSNVWHYAGVNSFRAGRMDELRAHPTAKPVALVADAIKDCTRRGEIVLDTFSGSGTTIIAAEKVGRHARALEIDPRYVDAAIRRWQACTKRDAIHEPTGRTFDEVAAAAVARRRRAK